VQGALLLGRVDGSRQSDSGNQLKVIGFAFSVNEACKCSL
jgi:hypothetical protein